MKKPGPPSEGSRGGRPPDRDGRNLSETDRALWRVTASTLKPLKTAKPRVHAALEHVPKAEPSLAKGAKPGSSGARPKPSSQKAPAPPPPPVVRSRKPPPLADFDTSRARKLRSGQVDIDARIDLHGMRQAEAHIALRGFLHAAHRKGHRVVLVITGKGAPAGGSRDEHWSDSMGRHERGILRRNVPMWLAEPELRAIVVSFTTAAIRHGGDGALYVHLRRSR